jgi:pimeloyl-ACP methyl ester carboxylesterase
MTPTAADWGGISRFVDIGGPVHYADFGGPPDRPPVVLVHGLAGSHLNWCLLAPILARHFRVVAVDLLGFGLSHPQGRSATVRANAAMLNEFLGRTVGTPAILVGNSMGGLVATLQAAAHPNTVSGLVLIDPALPFALGIRPDRRVVAVLLGLAVPGVGRWSLAHDRVRLSARQQVRRLMWLCCADPTAMPEDLIEASVALVRARAREPGLDTAFLQAVRSMFAVNARPHAAWARIGRVRAPVLLLHGARDRLVPVEAARLAARRNPSWTVELYPELGHVPQLESPDRVATDIVAWMDKAGKIPA